MPATPRPNITNRSYTRACPPPTQLNINAGAVCMICQISAITTQYSLTLTSLTAQQHHLLSSRQKLLSQRVKLARQPFSASLRRMKRCLARHNALLELKSQHLAAKALQAKLDLDAEIADVKASEGETACAAACMMPYEFSEEAACKWLGKVAECFGDESAVLYQGY